MPLTPPGLTGTLVTGLAATTHLGPAMPRLAAGIAAGVMLWTPLVKATTVDVGQLGTGAGITPLLVPQPALLAAFSGTFAGQAIIGIYAPLTILGISTGLATGFLQGTVNTIHPTIGVGAGVVKLTGPPATPLIIQGFASVGMVGVGSARLATAIGLGLDIVLSALVLPTVIAGAGSPASGGGSGYGQIV